MTSNLNDYMIEKLDKIIRLLDIIATSTVKQALVHNENNNS
jgi:hypothetical protein